MEVTLPIQRHVVLPNSAYPVEKPETELKKAEQLFQENVNLLSVAKSVLSLHLYSRQQVNASLKCQRTQCFWYL